MPTPKKLLKDKIAALLPEDQRMVVTDIAQLNSLYIQLMASKMTAVVEANFQSPKAFAELCEVTLNFAQVNGFDSTTIAIIGAAQWAQEGDYSNKALIDRDKTGTDGQ